MNSQTVFRTRSGRKYHVEDCTIIRRRVSPINRNDDEARGLEPCLVCRPDDNIGNGNENPTVFRTRSGRKYHEEDCTTIRRRVSPINRNDDEARGLEPCKFCNP